MNQLYICSLHKFYIHMFICRHLGIHQGYIFWKLCFYQRTCIKRSMQSQYGWSSYLLSYCTHPNNSSTISQSNCFCLFYWALLQYFFDKKCTYSYNFTSQSWLFTFSLLGVHWDQYSIHSVYLEFLNG